MTERELLRTLSELHDRLAKTVEIDAPTRDALRALAADIERVVSGGQGSTGLSQDHLASIDERLRKSIVDFESRHPHLAASLGQLVDGLANLGI